MMDKITVIVPVYNSQNYLDKCIQSILDQSYKNLEIIIIDDGSQDDSYKICRKYEEIDNRIVLITQKNAGVSNTRNTAIDLAKGKYIGFVDADDYIEETMFENLHLKAEESNADICFCNYYEGANNNFIEKVIPQIILQNPNKANFFNSFLSLTNKNNSNMGGMVWRTLIKGEFIKENKISFDMNLKIQEDLLFIMKILSLEPIITFVRKPLYYYCIRNDSVSAKVDEGFWENYLFFYNEVVKMIKSRELQNRLNINLIKYAVICGKNVVLKCENRGKLQRLKNIYRTKELAEAKGDIDCNLLTTNERLLYILNYKYIGYVFTCMIKSLQILVRSSKNICIKSY